MYQVVFPILPALKILKDHYYECFKDDEKYYQNIVLTCSMVALAIASGYLSPIVLSTVGGLLMSTVGGNLTYAMVLTEAGYAFSLICIHFLINVLNSIVATKLFANLGFSLKQKLTKLWLSKNRFYSLKFLKESENIYFAKILNKSSSLITHAANYIYEWIQTVSSVAFSIVEILKYNPHITLNIFSVSVFIPYYVFVASAIYGIGFYFINKHLETLKKCFAKKLSKFRTKISKRANDIEANSESIALLQGANQEMANLQKEYNEEEGFSFNSEVVSDISGIFSESKSHLDQLLSILLNAPLLLAKQITIDELAERSSYMFSMLSLFSFYQRYANYTSYLEHESDHIWDLKNAFKALEGKFSISPKVSHLSENLQLSDFTLKKPDNTVLISNTNLTIEQGSRVLLRGRSGQGKTTFIRALAGIWPFYDGNIQLPLLAKDSSMFLPSETYLPNNSSLLDSIVYPKNASSFTQKDIDDIKGLMKKLNIKQEIIDDILKVDDWKKRLSNGENHRINILPGLIFKPQLLIMDESTSNVDHDTKIVIQQLLKEHLKDSIIIAIDHNPLINDPSDFYNYELSLAEQKFEKHRINKT